LRPLAPEGPEHPSRDGDEPDAEYRDEHERNEQIQVLDRFLYGGGPTPPDFKLMQCPDSLLFWMWGESRKSEGEVKDGDDDEPKQLARDRHPKADWLLGTQNRRPTE
jgi:hypothetical protein